MGSSRKGSNSERELVKMFLDVGWQALRIAGSGRMNLAPDLLAGHPGKLLVIECKSSKKPAIYVNHEEVLNVIEYANKFGGEPWYAFRFNRFAWKFVPAQSMLACNKAVPDAGIEFGVLILKHQKTMQ